MDGASIGSGLSKQALYDPAEERQRRAEARRQASLREFEEASRELAEVAALRSERDLEFEETASPEIAREVMALYRSGASRAEMRSAYAALEEREKRELSCRVTDEERRELIDAAEFMERSGSASARSAYRATYCRIRDDVKLRDRLSTMDPGIAAAWREADELERSGLAPQEVAAELRGRIDPNVLSAMDDLANTAEGVPLQRFEPSSKKAVPGTKLRKGFLVGRTHGLERTRELEPKAVKAGTSIEHTLPAFVASRLGLSKPALAEHTCAKVLDILSRSPRSIDDAARLLELSVASARCRQSEAEIAKAFEDAVLRLSLIHPYEGAPLDPRVVDFMFEVRILRGAFFS